MALYKKTIALFFLLLVTFSGAIGQEMLRASSAASVQTQVTVIPPYPFHFQGLIRQQGNAVTLQNLSGSPLQLKLHFKMVSIDGIVSIETRPGVRPSQPINLAPHGGLRLGFAQLGELLSPSQLLVAGIRSEDLVSSQPMPEGYYTICITPENYNDPTVLGREACSVTFPMMSIEPPTLRLTNLLMNDTVQQVAPQHLVFQWNTPSNLNLGLLGSIKTTLKLVEVPKGMMPEQAMLNAPYYSPRFEVKGQNLFIYGPTQSPLVKGRRYAAVIQMTDPQNRVSFRNNGTSEVISFVFGKAASNDIENQASRLQGSVQWAYKASEEEQNVSNTPLVSATPIEEKVQALSKANEPGKNTYSLAGALVEVYGCNSPNLKNSKSIISSARTDEEGNYNMALILRQSMQKFKYLVVAISHPSGLFSKTEKVLNYNAVVNDYTLGNTVLLGQTLEFTPRVILADGTLNNQVSINILLPEKEWEKYELLSQAGFGKGRHNLFYNNQFYKVVTTLNSGDVFKHLFQTIHPNEHYLVQINYPNRPSAYYPLDEVYTPNKDENGNKQVIAISKNYGYNNSNSMSGIVTFRGVPKLDVRIKIAFNPNDVIGKYDVKNTFATVSDNDGTYTINGLPNFKKGAKVQVSLLDKTCRSFPLMDELVINKNGHLKKDYELALLAIELNGHVTDKQGNVMENVLVSLGQTNKTTRTNTNGDYSLVIESSELGNSLTMIADGYVEQKQGLESAIAIVGKKAKTLNNLDTPLVASLGITIIEKIPNKSSFDVDVVRLMDNAKITEGIVVITPLSGATKATTINLSTIGKNAYTYQVGNNIDPYGYLVEFQPSKNQEMTQSTAAVIVPLNLGEEHVKVHLKSGSTVVLSGTVKYKLSGSPVTQQLVTATDTVGGIPANYTARTDKSGKFQIIVRQNSGVNVKTLKTGYLLTDTSFSVTTFDVSFILSIQTSVGQNFTTLAGFPLTLTQIKDGGGGTYIISGIINLKGRSNSVFSLTGGTQLALSSQKVILDNSKANNALPITPTDSIDLKNVGSAVSLNGFGYAPLELSSSSVIKLKQISSTNKNGSIIGKIKLNPVMPSGVTYALPSATLIDTVGGKDSINTAFLFADATNPSNGFKLLFNPTTGGTVNVDLLPNMSLNLQSAILTDTGVTGVSGNLAIDSILSFTKSTVKTIPIQNCSFKTDFSFKKLVFYNAGNTIFSGSFQKVKANFSDIAITGVGTVNAQATFIGKMSVVKGATDLTFKDMTMEDNGGGKYSMSASLNLPSKEITVSRMKFEISPITPSATFSYIASNSTYNIFYPLLFEVSADSVSITNPAIKKVIGAIFPKKITGQFNLQTANFGVFIAADKNLKVTFKSLEINVNALVVSVGTNANIESMDSILKGYKSQNSPIVFDTTQISSSAGNWAFGISGGISFSHVSSLTGRGSGFSGGGIVLVSKTASGMDARVDSIGLEIDRPSWKLNANLKMVFDDEKEGGEIFASLEFKNTPMKPKKPGKINPTGFEATFKFYAYNNGDINIGASLTVNTKIVCGPVTFHSLGGGFELNTHTQEYSAFIKGSLGPSGVPEDVIKVNAKLEILFSGACNYVPIVTGTGSVVAGSILNIADAKSTLDFCNHYFLMQIASKFTLPGPLGGVDILSTLFIAAPSSKAPACFYLQADVQIGIKGIPLNVNGGFGIGWNVSSSNPFIPVNSLTMLEKVVGDSSLDGMYVYGRRSLGSKGSLGYSNAIINTSISWDLSSDFFCSFYADIKGGGITLAANLDVNLGASAKFQLLGFGPYLGGALKLNLKGSASYYISSGFDVKGSGSADLEIFGGVTTSGEDNSCNSSSVEYYRGCLNLGLFKVCGSFPCGVSAKVCVGANFDFQIQSNGAFKVNYSL